MHDAPLFLYLPEESLDCYGQHPTYGCVLAQMRPLVKDQFFKLVLLLVPGQPDDAQFGNDFSSGLVRYWVEIQHLFFCRRACYEGPSPEGVRINQNQAIGPVPMGNDADTAIIPPEVRFA